MISDEIVLRNDVRLGFCRIYRTRIVREIIVLDGEPLAYIQVQGISTIMECVVFENTIMHPIVQIESDIIVQERVITHSHMRKMKRGEFHAPIIVVNDVILNGEIIAFEINPDITPCDIVLSDDIPWRKIVTILKKNLNPVFTITDVLPDHVPLDDIPIGAPG